VPRSKAVIISIEFREGKIAMLHACNHVGGGCEAYAEVLRLSSSPWYESSA